MGTPNENIATAVEALTLQMSRVAWALEVEVRMGAPAESFLHDPCGKCGSLLVPADASVDACAACLEPKKEDADG